MVIYPHWWRFRHNLLNPTLLRIHSSLILNVFNFFSQKLHHGYLKTLGVVASCIITSTTMFLRYCTRLRPRNMVVSKLIHFLQQIILKRSIFETMTSIEKKKITYLHVKKTHIWQFIHTGDVFSIIYWSQHCWEAVFA